MESGQIQYLTLPPNYRNISRDDYSKVVAADAKSLNLFIPIRNHYNPNAATFGNFLAPSKLALTTIESLQLLGELASRAAAYDIQPAVRAQDGNVYPRVTVMYFRIPNAQGETVGRLARVFWLEGKEADEDGDITGMDNQVLKEKMIRERKQRRNIDHIMNWMIKQVSKAHWGKNLDKTKPRYWYHNTNREDYLNRFMSRVCLNARNAERDSLTRAFTNHNNPANIHNVFGMINALAAMELFGAAPEFTRVETWANNDFALDGPNYRGLVYRIAPNELHWDYLYHCAFPDTAQVSIDTNSSEFITQKDIFLRQRIREGGALPDPDAEMDEAKRAQLQHRRSLTMAEYEREAHEWALHALSLKYSSTLEIADRHTFRKANTAYITAEIERAKEAESKKQGATARSIFNAQAQARYRAQKERLKIWEAFLQLDSATSQAFVAIRNFLQAHLDNPKNKHKNFYRPAPARPEFRNLSQFGRFVAEWLLREEAVWGNFIVHTQSITVQFSALSVYFDILMQPYNMLMGDPMAGKSFVARALKRWIPYTVLFMQGESEKAMMASGLQAFKDKVKVQEEVPPTSMGLPEGDKVKRTGGKGAPQAMTDQGARFRSMATGGGEINYARLEKDEKTGKHKPDLIDEKLQMMLIGCMNMLPHHMPPNIRTRWLCMLFSSWIREGGYTLLNRVVTPTPDKYKHLEGEAMTETQLSQGLLAMAGLMMTVGIIRMPDFTAADCFIEEVSQLALAQGLPLDVRIIERSKALMRVLCVLFEQHAFYTDPDSPIKNLPHSWSHFLEQEKMFSVSIEQAVFVLSLLAEQFESPVLPEMLQAFNVKFTESYFHKDHKYSKIVRDQKRGGLVQTRIEDYGEAKDYVEFEIPGAPVALNRFGNNDDASASFESWIRRLYSQIEPHMSVKPPRETGEHYLASLKDIQVPCIKPGKPPIAGLQIDPNGKARIATVLLVDPRKGKFVRCIKETLCRPHKPQGRFVLGIVDPSKPFIFETFSNDPNDQLPDELKEFKEYCAKAQTWRKDIIKKFGLEPTADMTPAEKAARENMWPQFRPANSETMIYEILARHGGDNAKAEAMLRNCLLLPAEKYRDSVRLVDCNQEDAAALEDHAARLFNNEVAKQMVTFADEKKRMVKIQPSKRYKAYKLQQLDEATETVVGLLDKHPAEARRIRKELADKMTDGERKKVNMDMLVIETVLDMHRYPDCFESRNYLHFQKSALAHAIKNPDNFLTSKQASKTTAMLGFDFEPAAAAPAPAPAAMDEKGDAAFQTPPRPPPVLRDHSRPVQRSLALDSPPPPPPPDEDELLALVNEDQQPPEEKKEAPAAAPAPPRDEGKRGSKRKRSPSPRPPAAAAVASAVEAAVAAVEEEALGSSLWDDMAVAAQEEKDQKQPQQPPNASEVPDSPPPPRKRARGPPTPGKRRSRRQQMLENEQKMAAEEDAANTLQLSSDEKESKNDEEPSTEEEEEDDGDVGDMTPEEEDVEIALADLGEGEDEEDPDSEDAARFEVSDRQAELEDRAAQLAGMAEEQELRKQKGHRNLDEDE